MENMITYDSLYKEFKDYSDETTLHQIASIINSRLFELNFAKKFNLKCINAEGFDVINEYGLKFELKHVGFIGDCNTSITIGNLSHKRNIILYINKGIVDESDHWYFFPGTEFNRVCGLNKNEWGLIDDSEDAIELSWRRGRIYPKMFVQRFKGTSPRGKAMFAKHLNGNERWKINYLNSREFTEKEIYKIVNLYDESDFREYINYDHSTFEVEALCDDLDEYTKDYKDYL